MFNRLLLVDDDPAIRSMMEFSLTLEGFEVTTAADGFEGLKRASQSPPDAIVLDVMMPRMSGTAMLATIRRNPRLAQIPVLLVTAKTQEDEVWAGWQAGADSYITKPYEPDELLAEIRRVILRSSAAGARNGRSPRTLAVIA